LLEILLLLLLLDLVQHGRLDSHGSTGSIGMA
jgi:hypothetical protein